MKNKTFRNASLGLLSLLSLGAVVANDGFIQEQAATAPPFSSESPASAEPAKSRGKSDKPSSNKNAAAVTYNGSSINTRYGPIEVAITVQNNTISNITVPQYPNTNSSDTQINGYAIPILIQETIDAQSSSLDMVSGATYTSEGYLSSLQSALDKANL